MRYLSALACVVLVSASLVLGASPSKEPTVAGSVRVDGQRVWIPGVEGYKVVEPSFEAVAVVARYLGDKHPPEYVHGLAGTAFRIAGICPCAPTVDAAMTAMDLARVLGFGVTHVDMAGQAKGWEDLAPLAGLYRKNGNKVPAPSTLTDSMLKAQAQRVLEIIDSVKAAVRRGTPVVVWHAFTTAEYDVVAGYDDQTGEFLGWGSYGNPKDGSYAHAPQGRMVEAGDIGGLPNAMILSGSPKPVARDAEVAALREAVAHGRSRKNLDKANDGEWHMLQGIACYSRWATDWEHPAKKREMGDAYCVGIYSRTHATAAPFLRQIAPSYPKARKELEKAAGAFEAEAKLLEQSRAYLWWDAPAGPAPERNRKAAAVLAEARDRYADGIAAIEKAVERIERQGAD